VSWQKFLVFVAYFPIYFFLFHNFILFRGERTLHAFSTGKTRQRKNLKKKMKQVTFEPLFSCKWQPEPTGDGQEKDRGLDSWTSFGHNPRRLLSAAVWLSLAATLKLQLFAIAWLRWHFSFSSFLYQLFPSKLLTLNSFWGQKFSTHSDIL